MGKQPILHSGPHHGEDKDTLTTKPREPSDFCFIGSPPAQRLSQFERLTITGGADLERAFAWILKQLSTLTLPEKSNSFDAKQFLEAGLFYTQSMWRDVPEQFFEKPHHEPIVDMRPIHGLRDGTILDIEFTSKFVPHHPHFRERYVREFENQRVHARWWKHHERNAPTLIALHGWSMGDQRLNSLAFMTGHLYELGYDVVLMELPYHGRRKGSFERSPFPSLDIVRTNEAMGQAISDLRELRLFLEAHGAHSIGCIGMSLGGYIGALWASLDRLDRLVALVPLASLNDLAWKLISQEYSTAVLKQHGVTRAVVEAMLSIHSPLRFQLKVPKAETLIIAGRKDELIPAKHPKALWAHWGEPEMHWFRGGHLAHFKDQGALKAVMAFLSRE